jgi:hypothetical protein
LTISHEENGLKQRHRISISNIFCKACAGTRSTACCRRERSDSEKKWLLNSWRRGRAVRGSNANPVKIDIEKQSKHSIAPIFLRQQVALVCTDAPGASAEAKSLLHSHTEPFDAPRKLVDDTLTLVSDQWMGGTKQKITGD